MPLRDHFHPPLNIVYPGVVIVDTVNTRRSNMHDAIADALEAGADLAWKSKSGLAAVAYRTAAESGVTRVEAWPHPLAVGAVLPTLPLWLGVDLCVPLPLEETYTTACQNLRMR